MGGLIWKGESLGKSKARHTVESSPRYQKGVFIVTRERMQRRAEILWGFGIGLAFVAFPALLGVLHGALS